MMLIGWKEDIAIKKLAQREAQRGGEGEREKFHLGKEAA